MRWIGGRLRAKHRRYADGGGADVDGEDVVKRGADKGRALRQGRFKQRLQLGGRAFGVVVLDGDEGRLPVGAGGNEVY